MCLVLRCVIPEGTKYFLDRGAKLCSKSIKIVEVL